MASSIMRILTILSIILLLLTASTTLILNTSLLTPVSQNLINQFSPTPLSIEEATYSAPNHFILKGVSSPEAIDIEKIEAWPTLSWSQFKTPEFDALLFTGLSVSKAQGLALTSRHWIIHQLAISNMQYNDGPWTIKNADIQWWEPKWDKNQTLPYGKFEFHTPLLSYGSQQFDQVLVTGEQNRTTTRINGLSFNWNEAQIEAQAYKTADLWTLDELTIENLNLSDSDLSREKINEFSTLRQSVAKIERLDIIRGQLKLENLLFNNLELSATNIDPNQPLIWGQDNSSLSLQADSINYDGQLWIQPNISASLTVDNINIHDLNVGLSGGDIYLSADLAPKRVDIREASIIAVKHSMEESSSSYDYLFKYLAQLEQFSIHKLSVHNSQFIQLAQQPYWQLSGANVELKDATLIEKNRWGLWQGEFYASVNSASYDSVIATQAILEMKSLDGTWEVSRFFMPLTKGYVAARGEWNFQSSGKPWHIDVETDSLPLKLFKAFSLPFNSKGLLDLQMTANGLSGDEAIIRHTLSGSVDSSIRKGSLVLSLDDHKIYQPFNLESWHLSAEKGVIESQRAKITGPGFNAVLEGSENLTTPDEEQGLSLIFNHQGEPITFPLFH